MRRTMEGTKGITDDTGFDKRSLQSYATIAVK